MLKQIVHFSLRFHGVIITIASVLVLYGLYVASQIKLDVFPEFAPPQIFVQTEAPGLSAEEVEALVTRLVENGLNGTRDLTNLYSQSIPGLSVVTAVFRDRADIYQVRQLVGERLTDIATQLPQGVAAPRMGALTASTSLILVMGLTSEGRTPMDLRTFADRALGVRLLGVPGVARVDVFGGEVRQIQIQVHPDRLLAFGLSLDEVLAAARKSTGVRGAGFIENENQRISLRVRGQSLSAEELGEVVLTWQGGVSVRLKDVARVVDGAQPQTGGGQVMGKRGIIMLVHGQYGANTPEITHAVEQELEQMEPLFAAEHITVYPQLFRPANFIETSIRNINESLLIGGALVIVILYCFLANLRGAFIIITTIPFSLLAAVIVLDWFGVSLNTLTLAGFAISIGIVVDDAIIGLENVLRRLRENRSRSSPRPIFRVVLDATLEVRTPVVYATFIVAAVFWPVLMMTGVNGRLFAPLATAFILATLASLIAAMTLTPALCYTLLAQSKADQPAYIDWLKRGHRRCLEALARYPAMAMAMTAGLCLLALVSLPFLGGEFLPEFKEGHYIIRMLAAPGTSLETSLNIGSAVTRELLTNPHIRSVSQQVGRAEQGEDTVGPNFNEFHVDLNPLSGAEEEQVKRYLHKTLAAYPGVLSVITPYLQERIEEIIAGGHGEVIVNIFGDDLEVLDRKAREIRDIVARVSGASDVLVEAQSGAPEVAITLRKDRLRQFGFQPLDVLDTIQTAFDGSVAAQTYDNNWVVDVAVILDPDSRTDPENIGALLIQNAAGTRLPLRELADVELTAGRHVILHEGARRLRSVSCNVEGRDLSSFVAELKARIKSEVTFPHGVYVAYAGAANAQARAQMEMSLHALIAAVVIILLLYVVFENMRNTLLVLANLPFALTGGVLAAFLSGGTLSLGSLVGLVALFGISTRNSILMISRYQDLVAEEGMPWGSETAIRGATERLLPILLTALVVALGLLPIALGSGEAGREIEGPMAIMILGGLVTSTILNLIVLPTLALRFGKFQSSADRASISPPDLDFSA